MCARSLAAVLLLLGPASLLANDGKKDAKPEDDKPLHVFRGTLLVEHTASDAYWGDGGDGSGKNKLGRILMSVREELRSE